MSDKSIDSISSDPARFSTKVNSLLNFLDEIDDRSDNSVRRSSKLRVDEKRVDESNDPQSSNARLIREKKYVWDDWDEVLVKDPIHQKKYIWDDDEMAMLDEETKCLLNDWEGTEHLDAQLIDDKPKVAKDESDVVSGKQSKRCPADARLQLQLLKSMSEEVQTRADTMKTQLEQSTREVEDLHAIRIKNESDHVQKMILLKQVWKQRIEDVNAEHEKFMNSHDKLKETLTIDCEMMEKQVVSIQAEIARAILSEKEICDRLRSDGTRALDDARRMWQQAEKDELKKNDHKTSLKLKKDAAKAVESKLRQLIERNKEELERMERETERELEFYKLELFKRSNEEFRKATNKMRDEERSRVLNLENDWIAKLEIARREREHDLKKICDEFEQRADILKRQLTADNQRIADEHQTSMAEAQMVVEMELERVRAQHEQEMVELEEGYRIKMAQQQKSSEIEFKQWQIRRHSELMAGEEMRLKEDYEQLRNKFQSDINLVKQKLAEEQAEKNESTDGGWQATTLDDNCT